MKKKNMARITYMRDDKKKLMLFNEQVNPYLLLKIALI